MCWLSHNESSAMTINSALDNQMAAFWPIRHKQALQAAVLCL
ncbi:hypothetical protein ymoll0001_25760 [Yersinia mollaretii ATCC 43969]|uniref:Uncharacterized protein n=1 Tax=Yersinia mollaretii (strain ATCC 43969 / DSM 18520 / CIP 103324 / CNY 7263 / WAIP 204) TaxID=349967 RepID=A0ABM9YDY2_YERMW|nr:hypothetical protein ymoll0001_25760 [Yersinia mollaretii ATCC 43969]